jgi:hypothetical protein
MDDEIPERLMHRRQQCFAQPGVQTPGSVSSNPGFLNGNQMDRQSEMPVGSEQVGLFVN